MNKNELLRNIDSDIYISTCLEAKRLAIYTGKSNEIGITFDSMIPHNISEELWELDITVEDKLEIFFNLFEEMPCYAYLMYLAMEFKYKFNSNERIHVCSIFRRYLMGEYENFKIPICYSLWCDYLEDEQWSDFVWDNILQNDYENNMLIISLFSVSGPVSWNKKIELINKVIEKRELHCNTVNSLDTIFNDIFTETSHYNC